MGGLEEVGGKKDEGKTADLLRRVLPDEREEEEEEPDCLS